MAASSTLLRSIAAAAVVLASTLVAPAFAQSGPGGGFDANRDCQTIRRCNFTRNGSFRGCISAYSCRTCQLVNARCSINGNASNCRQMRCSWGA